MTFTQFIDTYGLTYSSAERAEKMEFDPETVGFNEFLKLYHKAVKLGLSPDDARVFMKKFNVDYDFNLDAAEEGLSLTDWACKRDPYSIWYSRFWHAVADGELNNKDLFPTIAANREVIAKEMTSKTHTPDNDIYVTDSGVVISSASRITANDLKKYGMPNFIESEEEVF